MKVRNWIKKLDSFKYIVDKMEFSSQIGRNLFLDREYSSDANYLIQWHNYQSSFQAVEKDNSSTINKLRLNIAEINDIRGSLSALEKGGVISEVELFEIKRIAYYSTKISEVLELLNYKTLIVESLSPVFRLLDPQNSNLLSFYIYDEYSELLKKLRGELKQSNNPLSIEQLYNDIENEQIEVLTSLSKKIKEFVPVLKRVIESIAVIDFIVCATTLYKNYAMNKPEISSDNTNINSLFNPFVMERVEARGGEFQRVDISFNNAPTLICGANMSGKSVILNSVALCQLLTQFGMYVTASNAQIALKDNILLSLNDESSLSSGLSSFAKEILSINSMVEYIKNGGKPLILIDEAARTTNPIEGVAIVSAVIDILKQSNTSALITTHYSGIKSKCRFLRVKGVMPNKIEESITVDNISKYIDYSLQEIEMGDAPQEAITIAEMLGVDEDFITKAKIYIN